MNKYAVIVEETIHIPGDERSRTNPGHGYPARTETKQVFLAFGSEDDFIDWVKEANKGYRRFVPIVYREVKITTETKTSITLA